MTVCSNCLLCKDYETKSLQYFHSLHSVIIIVFSTSLLFLVVYL